MFDFKYALSVVKISWSDIKWAYDNGKLTWRDIVDFAKSQLDNLENYFEINELSKVSKENIWRINDILALLVKDRVGCEQAISDKFMLIELSMITNNRNENAKPNPVDAVTDIYEEYNCPKELDCFIPWRPAINGVSYPDLYSSHDNYKNYYDKLEKYINSKLVNYKDI